MHFALIRFSSLGDIVLQTSFVSWLKLSFPECRITFITSKEFSSLVDGHPHIDEVICIERKKGKADIQQLRNLAVKLNQSSIDLIVDLHGTLRAKALKLFAYKIPSIMVDKRSFLRKVLVRFKIDLLQKVSPHVERTIEDWQFLFRSYLGKDETSEFINQASEKKSLGLTTLPNSFKASNKRYPDKYLAISPVASFETKRWPMEKVSALLNLIFSDDFLDDYKVLLIAGPKDDYVDQIQGDWGERFINLKGKTSLNESAELLGQAEVVVTNDTGSAHMAEAHGAPVISIFGSTSPSFGFRPHLKRSRFLVSSVNCHPCSATGSKSCSKQNLECMDAIQPSQVLNVIKEIIREKYD